MRCCEIGPFPRTLAVRQFLGCGPCDQVVLLAVDEFFSALAFKFATSILYIHSIFATPPYSLYASRHIASFEFRPPTPVGADLILHSLPNTKRGDTTVLCR